MMTAELRRRLLNNQKRVARLIREDNAVAIQPRAFVVTTDSQHEVKGYLSLARHLRSLQSSAAYLKGFANLSPDRLSVYP